MCLSTKCSLRFWGVEHFRSHVSTKQPYYTFEIVRVSDLANERLMHA